jgi:hypothetical protein
MFTTSITQLTNYASNTELKISQISLLKGPLFVTLELTDLECNHATYNGYT